MTRRPVRYGRYKRSRGTNANSDHGWRWKLASTGARTKIAAPRDAARRSQRNEAAKKSLTIAAASSKSPAAAWFTQLTIAAATPCRSHTRIFHRGTRNNPSFAFLRCPHTGRRAANNRLQCRRRRSSGASHRRPRRARATCSSGNPRPPGRCTCLPCTCQTCRFQPWLRQAS